MKRLVKANFVFIVAVLVPLPIVLYSIFNGSMPFWFDPARDYLAAIANQSKITLIGQPTGIPGLFYGPYWIWLLSVGLFISKDPRVVQFLTLGIAYLFIFPFVLFKFKNILGKTSVIFIWLLFIFSYMRYAIYPWNPHLAPLLALSSIYLLIAMPKKRYWLYSFGAGLASGLMGNFHLSFSVGFVIGVFLYFVFEFIRSIGLVQLKKSIAIIGTYLFGFSIAFIPFTLFEVRHGFYQIKTIINALTSPYAQVGLKGLDKQAILSTLLSNPGQIFQLPSNIGLAVLLICLVVFALGLATKKIKFENYEIKLIILCVLIIFSVFAIFYESKNPVWEYHFIAMEIPVLLIIGMLFKKMLISKLLISLIVMTILITSYYNFIFVKHPSIMAYDTLGKKEYIVDLINRDAESKDYSVFVYNPGIYTYDYSYLFKYNAGKDFSYDPSQIKGGGQLIYLVIQKTSKPIFDDFLNYHTNNLKYKTTQVWAIADGTKVLRRELK